jgi:hypothetical protein
MEASRTAYQIYTSYVVSADYVIKLIFLGISIVKYSEKRLPQHEETHRLAHRAHA